jgi:hypothetical protein
MRQPRLRWRGLAALNLVLLACMALACGPTAKDKTRRMTPVVWAGAPAANPPLLDHDNWQDLNKGDAIRTDSNGQAELELVGCSGTLYVFKNSVMQVATCLKTEQASGLATCAQQGTGWFNIDCTSRFVVDTLAGRVTIAGTTFSVTYLPERQLLLVIVFAGRVAVQPVIDFDTGELGTQTTLVETGQFLYTMPGPESPALPGGSPRTPLPLEQLPPLVDELGIRPWIDDIGLRARQDGVLPANWPFRGQPGLVNVAFLGGGGALEDVRVQRAVLAAMDKEAILATTFPGRQVAFIATVGGEEIDARTIEYNPAGARELLTAADQPRRLVVLLVFPAEDEQLSRMAEEMVGYLAKVGIDIRLSPVPAAELRVAVNTTLQAGEPVLWLERR